MTRKKSGSAGIDVTSFSIGSDRRWSVSAWMITVASLRASTTSSR
jgi:hypothetical protein